MTYRAHQSCIHAVACAGAAAAASAAARSLDVTISDASGSHCHGCTPNRPVQIFRSLGTDWDERVLPSIGNEVLKSVVAQYQAEQLLTQRDAVRP